MNPYRRINQLEEQNTELASMLAAYQRGFNQLGQALSKTLPYAAKEMYREAKGLALKNARRVAVVANWPLQAVSVNVDGMTMRVTPLTYGRFENQRTEIGTDGEKGRNVTTTEGKASIQIFVPFFGPQMVIGDLLHTEIGQSGSDSVEVSNVLTFTINIGGTDRQVKIETSGYIADYGVAIRVLQTKPAMARVNNWWCDGCMTTHDNVTYNVKVTIS